MGAHSEGIRIGVVGVGYCGSKHLRVLRSTTGVATVLGVDQRFTGNDGIPQQLDFVVVGYTDIEHALPNVDAVVIATPPLTRARLSLQAVEADKPVLVENPLATTIAEAQLVIDAAESAGLVLMVGHALEHNAAVHNLRDLVQGGELGDLYYLDCARLNLGLCQPDVIVIMDLALHDISVANFVLGSRPTSVTAWGPRHVHPDFEDVARLLLEYGDLGVRPSIQLSWLGPQKVLRVTAVGSKKMAVYDDLVADERIRVYDEAAVPPEGTDGPLSRVAYHMGDIVSHGRHRRALRAVRRAAGRAGPELRRLHHRRLPAIGRRQQRAGRGAKSSSVRRSRYASSGLSGWPRSPGPPPPSPLSASSSRTDRRATPGMTHRSLRGVIKRGRCAH